MNRLEIPYSTDDFTLAVALLCSGVKFIEVQRIYSPEDERRFGLRARECTRKNLGGRLLFIFDSDPKIETLAAAVAAQKESASLDIDLAPEIAARMAFFVLQIRKQLSELCVSPENAFVLDAGASERSSDGQRITTRDIRYGRDTDAIRKKLKL